MTTSVVRDINPPTSSRWSFSIYEYYLLGQNPKKSLYDELQRAFKDKDPNVLIGDIKKFANTYFHQLFEEEDKVLYSFWYLRWNMYWKSILLTALHTNYSGYEELKTELRRFYYLYWIAGKTLSQIKQTSFNLIKWVKANRPINEISEELDTKLGDDRIIELATNNLASEQITSAPWCKPLLLMMEYNITDDSKLSFIPLSKYLHLEHVLPIKYEKFEEWGHISKEISSKWLNSAGNITLLCGAKNIEASNNPFAVKMDVYKGKGKYDDKNDKISAFLITQKILLNFEKNKFDGQWNLESMIERWKWFFGEVSELLDIDLSEVIEKHEPTLV